MPKPALVDFATILDKENMEPLFDTVWGALQAAKTVEEARQVLGITEIQDLISSCLIDITDQIQLLELELNVKIQNLEARVTALENGSALPFLAGQTKVS